MRKLTVASAIAALLLLAPQLQAARCKVNGQWYEYESPQCNANTEIAPEAVSDLPDGETALPEPAPAISAPIASSITGPDLMRSHLRPWSEVRYLAEQNCQGNRTVDCMLREENGYWAMHGNFSMPERFAAESKAICVGKTRSFTNQSLCMQNESMGYREFSEESDVPKAVVDAARKECMSTFTSWSQRGSCVASARHRFKNPNAQKRRRIAPTVAGLPTEPPPGYATVSELVTFNVRPPQRREGGLIAKIRPPSPLTLRQRAARLAQESSDPGVLSQAIAVLESEARHDFLTADKPVIEGVGSLSFYSPRMVRNKHGVRFSAEDNSHLGLTLYAEAGRLYLIDFVVRSFSPGSYVLTNNDKQYIYEDLGGAIRNVTARVIVEEPGAIYLKLRNQFGTGFDFYAVGVTSVEATGHFEP